VLPLAAQQVQQQQVLVVVWVLVVLWVLAVQA
jgi:hypothetical protein